MLSLRLAVVRARPRRREARPLAARLALAATTTHDLPTVAGVITGSDLNHLCDIGVAVPGGPEQGDQQAQRESLCRLLEEEGLLAQGERGVTAIVAALYCFLARTQSMLVAATLEDAVEAHERPQCPRHYRPAPELVAAPARPARRPGRRPPGPAAGGILRNGTNAAGSGGSKILPEYVAWRTI